jgi:hypothetical protein
LSLIDHLRFLKPGMADHRLYAFVEHAFLQLVEAKSHHALHVLRQDGDVLLGRSHPA